MNRHREDLGIVHATLHDDVDFDGCESGDARRFDALEHLFHAAETTAHGGEYRRVETVETHGDASEAGGLQFGGVFGQQHAVGGERDVFDSRQRAEIAHEVGEVRAQQGLAARDAQLAHAERRGDARQTHDFLERKSLRRFEETITLVERVLRHAIRTTKIAAVHHRDAQVAHRATERVAIAAAIEGQGSGRLAHGVTTGTAGSRTLWGIRSVPAATRRAHRYRRAM